MAEYIPITWDMIDHWTSPQGYSDLNGTDGSDDIVVIGTVAGSPAIMVKDKSGHVNYVAVEARTVDEDNRCDTCPRWRTNYKAREIEALFVPGRKEPLALPEPDFSLEEIELSEKLVG